MSIITLTTDFGSADGYVGAMKGVILGIAPDVRLVDLSHEIAAQDVRGAEYVLGRAAAFFPAGTVHLAVVDPGVGSRRRPLLITTPRAIYVGPDNGLFTFALDGSRGGGFRAGSARVLAAEYQPYFSWSRHLRPSRRARGARGCAPHARQPHQRSRASAPVAPQRHTDGHVAGHVIHVDRFGNLITDIPGGWVGEGRWCVEIAGRRISQFGTTYADATAGALLILVSSAGTLEIAARDGNAAAQLGVGVGEAAIFRPVL